MKTEFITGSSGFTAETYDQAAPVNALITGSENLWFDANGDLEVCGGTILSPDTIAGDVAFLFGDGYGTIGDGAGTGRGNAAKYIGNAMVFVTNDDINILDPSLDVDPFIIPFAGAAAAPPLIATSALEAGVPYIAPWNPTLGAYQAPVVIGLLPQEEAPELILPLALGSGFTGKNNGIYSTRISYNRPDTGGESLTSPSSNTLGFSNSSVAIRFPLPTTPRYTRDSPLAWDTNDFWKLYSTPVNFGNTTVFLLLREIRERRLASEDYTTWTATTAAGVTTITLTAELLTYLFTVEELNEWLVGKTVTSGADSGVITEVVSTSVFKVDSTFATLSGSTINIDSLVDGFSDERLIELEWTENDLSAEVPATNFYPPYTSDEFFGDDFENIAKFIVPLNNVMLLIGTDGGTGIRVSVPNFIEAFPPDYTLNLPETPIAVSYRAEDGYCYIICKNSVHEARWTGAVSGAPVVLRTISTNIGAASQKSFFTLNGVVYLYTSNNRLVRITPDGQYDYQFSTPITPYISSWTPENVSIAYDENRNAICVFHNREFLAFHIDLGTWSTPILFSRFTAGANIPDGNILTALTYRGIIHLFDTTVSNTYLLDRNLVGTLASNVSSAVAKFQWNHLNHELLGKTIKEAQLISQNLSTATLTLDFYRDHRATAMGATRTISYASGETFSKITGCNNGVGRLISPKISIDACTRGVINTLRLSFDVTAIRANF